ncbi:MAG: outer membrane lipoprotein-sorting protein [Candidatus Bipolaricaulota bacterium]|nr:outer membrane lipoprotein-sorting protein [Candidatus Bipolaricaulota bacterium]
MKRETRWGVCLTLVVGILIVGALGAMAAGLTGDEILQKVDDEAASLAEGSLISVVQFDNVYADGTSASNVFAGMGKKNEGEPEESLIYFKQPEDVAGTIFLSVKPVGEDARMWLYLPALGMAKELVADQQEQSFAGSTFSYKDMGNRSYADKYAAELVGEEILTIGDEQRVCYMLAFTARPGADADYPSAKAWVDKESFLMLKSEDYNESGNLERTMDVLSLTKFDGQLLAGKMLATNALDNSSTTITFVKRQRPESDIPESVFNPENLATFDPVAYGFY